jgi:hypothetical protein
MEGGRDTAILYNICRNEPKKHKIFAAINCNGTSNQKEKAFRNCG